MPKTKEILQRIHSTTASRQITQAMKMVAAAKLAKAKKNAVSLLTYSKQLTQIFEQVAFDSSNTLASPYFLQRREAGVLIIFVTTNKGFCGALNNHILKKVAEEHLQYVAAGKQVEFLPIGKKGLSFLAKNTLSYTPAFTHFGEDIDLEQTTQLSEFILKAFEEQRYDKVIIINQSSGIATRHGITTKQLLPVLPTPTTLAKQQPIDFCYEPSQQAIVSYVLPKIITLLLYQSLLTASIAEHTARMIAMGKATDNADVLLRDFRLAYNRTRQAAVTRQIIEIAAGAEALQ